MNEILVAANNIRNSRMELQRAERILARHNLLVTDGHFEKMETLRDAEQAKILNYIDAALRSTQLETGAAQFAAMRKIRRFL